MKSLMVEKFEIDFCKESNDIITKINKNDMYIEMLKNNFFSYIKIPNDDWNPILISEARKIGIEFLDYLNSSQIKNVLENIEKYLKIIENSDNNTIFYNDVFLKKIMETYVKNKSNIKIKDEKMTITKIFIKSPKESRTMENLKYFLENGGDFKYIDKKHRTEDLLKIAIINNCKNIIYMPSENYETHLQNKVKIFFLEKERFLIGIFLSTFLISVFGIFYSIACFLIFLNFLSILSLFLFLMLTLISMFHEDIIMFISIKIFKIIGCHKKKTS